jgi:hypothetical protein
MATAFLDQAADGPSNVAFLPGYYAILNLAKAYILFSPLHAELTQHKRWHGATYRVDKKDSRNLLTEEIELQTGGALALFYQVLTGLRIDQKYSVRMGDMYSVLQYSSSEYGIAAKKTSSLVDVELDIEYHTSGRWRPVLSVLDETPQGLSARSLKLLRQCRTLSAADKTFCGPWYSDHPNETVDVHRALKCHLIYQPIDPRSAEDEFQTPISAKRLELAEEFPIALVFFHLGSVVRYKPELFERLRDSRYWPLMRSTREHAMIRFMSLFWSYVRQKNIDFQRF